MLYNDQITKIHVYNIKGAVSHIILSFVVHDIWTALLKWELIKINMIHPLPYGW